MDSTSGSKNNSRTVVCRHNRHDMYEPNGGRRVSRIAAFPLTSEHSGENRGRGWQRARSCRLLAE
ncbi:hypothetical protein Pla52o_12090 [Novipirellula galeiformis]|uniref:Uncharacterized protein n=1 Tax=Novipirellula galeiformis TaxID=2528004 RepID=A0A5C6CKH4_9BACT|nr:hypothetical protein Pla52o_12090 [Novipirellula galeiformis]